MFDYLADLFGRAQFVPHAVCLLWRPDLLVMHGLSDLLIALAYLAIPFVIIRVVRARPDLLDTRVARMFAWFILACAFSHIAGLITLWVPAYGLQGVIKIATAVISVYTAIQLARLLPVFLSMPSRDELAKRDADLIVSERRTRQAEAARDRLTEFASIAAHDLKAPLRGISNQATFLVEDHAESLNEQARKRLTRINELCRHLDGLIATLLEYSRVGKSDDHEATRVDEVVKEVERSLLELIVEEDATVEIDTPLPTVKASKSDLRIVFQNLIENGIKYNEAEKKRVRIGFLTDVMIDGSQLSNVFYVRDNGSGIDPEFHSDVFRIFKRIDSSKDGSGVGLAFVRKIVESYGGEIRLLSRRGAGSTFYFSFMPQHEPQEITNTGIQTGLGYVN